MGVPPNATKILWRSTFPVSHETNSWEIPKGHPKGSALDCGDLSPLFHAKLAEPDFRGLATFIEAKRKSDPILRRGTAQQASPRESGDKSHAVHRLRHPLLSFYPMGSISL